jgi:hypothetical protein
MVEATYFQNTEAELTIWPRELRIGEVRNWAAYNVAKNRFGLLISHYEARISEEEKQHTPRHMICRRRVRQPESFRFRYGGLRASGQHHGGWRIAGILPPYG